MPKSHSLKRESDNKTLFGLISLCTKPESWHVLTATQICAKIVNISFSYNYLELLDK